MLHRHALERVHEGPAFLVANPGHFRIHFEDKNPSGDFFWDVDDFASTACVRDGT